MARKKRKVPSLNASSTADISFILLIFFLVTTSMDTDSGLARRLPPPPEEYIYSEDVVTLIEQVINWNDTTAIDSEKIELFVKDETGNELYSTYNRTEFLEQYKLRGDPSHAEEKEFRFSCNVEMNSSSGRVNKITIQRRGERELEITER